MASTGTIVATETGDVSNVSGLLAQPVTGTMDATAGDDFVDANEDWYGYVTVTLSSVDARESRLNLPKVPKLEDVVAEKWLTISRSSTMDEFNRLAKDFLAKYENDETLNTIVNGLQTTVQNLNSTVGDVVITTSTVTNSNGDITVGGNRMVFGKSGVIDTTDDSPADIAPHDIVIFEVEQVLGVAAALGIRIQVAAPSGAWSTVWSRIMTDNTSVQTSTTEIIVPSGYKVRAGITDTDDDLGEDLSMVLKFRSL